MFFTIDEHNGVAIYEQIVRQVKFAIADGTLLPGQLLPSGRVLSVQLAINPNTVARAFQELQSEGVLESLRGRGLIVSPGATERCKEMRKTIVARRIRSVLSEALHGGLDASEILSIVSNQLNELEGQVPTVGAGSSQNPSSK